MQDTPPGDPHHAPLPSQAFTYWGHLTLRNLWLSIGVCLLGLAFCLDAGVRVYDAWRGRDVYFIPPGGPGIAQPGRIPDATALDYASRWLQERYTFTPETLDAVHTMIKASLHPRLSIEFEVQRKEEAKDVRTAKMSSQATTLRATMLQRTDTHVLVQVEGLQTVYVGQEQVHQESLTLTLGLVPWGSSGTPSGLLVARVVGPPPSKFVRK